MRRRSSLVLPVLVGLLVLSCGTVTVVAVAALVRREPAARPDAITVAVEPAGSRALRVLHQWDRRRARAWSHGSVPRLRALYAPGSTSAAADVAMLTAYRDRGLRVIGMRRQALAVRELDVTGRRLTLQATDRLVSAVAVGNGAREPLPRGGFVTQTLSFVLTADGWVRTG